MTTDLFLIFGIAYFLIGILSAQRVDQRAKDVGSAIIGITALVAAIMVAFPGIG